MPAFRRAGWALRRVLTDRGRKLEGVFAEACSELEIHHTRAEPWHAFSDADVELLRKAHLGVGVPHELMSHAQM